jgi:DNA-binding NarL/FixJ family response regulator
MIAPHPDEIAATAEHSRLARLTRRELEVLVLMAEGKSNAGIAEALYLTEHSVEKYVSSVLAKLGVTREIYTHRRVTAVLLYLANSSHA